MGTERITAILNGEIAPNIEDDDEMAAHTTRQSAVQSGRNLAYARRDAALKTAMAFFIASVERVPGHFDAFQAMLDEATENINAEFRRYCEEHPLPPEPLVEGMSLESF